MKGIAFMMPEAKNDDTTSRLPTDNTAVGMLRIEATRCITTGKALALLANIIERAVGNDSEEAVTLRTLFQAVKDKIKQNG